MKRLQGAALAPARPQARPYGALCAPRVVDDRMLLNAPVANGIVACAQIETPTNDAGVIVLAAGNLKAGQGARRLTEMQDRCPNEDMRHRLDAIALQRA